MIWSFALAAIGVAGLALAGSRKKIGWAIGVGAQALWITYAVATHQYGFIISAVAYAWVYGRNWLRWRRDELTGEEQSHIIEFRDDGWTIMHPLSCRPNLFSCPMNRAIRNVDGPPPGGVGRYRCSLAGDDRTLVVGDRA